MNLVICLKKIVKHIFKLLKKNSIMLTNQKEGNSIWLKKVQVWRSNRTKKNYQVSTAKKYYRSYRRFLNRHRIGLGDGPAFWIIPEFADIHCNYFSTTGDIENGREQFEAVPRGRKVPRAFIAERAPSIERRTRNKTFGAWLLSRRKRNYEKFGKIVQKSLITYGTRMSSKFNPFVHTCKFWLTE